MLLNTKRLAVSSLLLAVTILLIYLGNVIEGSTLFFLAAAGFCTGIVQREYKSAYGVVFTVAALLLGLMLSPHKLYVLTYLMFAVYILLTEACWKRICDIKDHKRSDMIFWGIRLVIFNLMYLPAVFINPRLLFGEEVLTRFGAWLYPALILSGQVFLVLFDRAYCYFQGVTWEKIRKNIQL